MLTHSLLQFLNSFPLSVQGAHTSVLVSVHICFLRECWISVIVVAWNWQPWVTIIKGLAWGRKCSSVLFSTYLLQKIINIEVPYLIIGFSLNVDTETLPLTHTKNLDLSNCCLFKSRITSHLSLGKTVRNCIRDVI